MSVGVPDAAAKPSHERISKPLNTAETGGISGIEAHGCALVTASARGRPS